MKSYDDGDMQLLVRARDIVRQLMRWHWGRAGTTQSCVRAAQAALDGAITNERRKAGLSLFAADDSQPTPELLKIEALEKELAVCRAHEKELCEYKQNGNSAAFDIVSLHTQVGELRRERDKLQKQLDDTRFTVRHAGGVVALEHAAEDIRGMWLRTANKSFVSALALREGCIENIDEARRIVQADTAHLIADRIDVMKNTVRDKLATRDKISVEVLREATLHVRNTGVTEACRHAQRSYIEALIGELGRFLPPVTGPTGATGVQGRNNHG